MGTRYLVMVAVKDVVKVAQFGAYDGYPAGAGVDIIRFFNKTNMASLKKKLKNVNMSVDNEKVVNHVCGTEILDVIMNSTDVVELDDAQDFAKSPSCEWIYYIDLTRKTLTVRYPRGVSSITIPLKKNTKEDIFLKP